MVSYEPLGKRDVDFVGTGPVPAAPYYDPAYYELEREAIFKRVWLHMGRTAEVPEPGRFIVRDIEVAKASILIVHGTDGKIRAFHNVCAHRSSQLVEREEGRATAFSCRYHAWTYDTQGRLRGVPDAENFFNLDKSKCGLREVALDICAGFIFVNLDRSPRQSLREFLGVWWDRLEALEIGDSEVFHEYVYECAGNWKTTLDNFQEVYHGRFVHPESIGDSTMGPENPFGYMKQYSFGPEDLHRSMTIWFNPGYDPGPVEAYANDVLRDFVIEQGYDLSKLGATELFFIFPNLELLSVGEQCFTQTIWPLGAGRSRATVRQYWEGKDTRASVRFGREYRVARTLDIHSEDRDIIELAQKGMEGGAHEHLHFQVNEVALRHAFHAVDRYVQDYRREMAAQRVAAE